MGTISAVIADLLAELGRGLAFPARMRLFCDSDLLGLLPQETQLRCEWPGASGGMLLAAATGAAWAEAGRGGQVLVVAPRIALAQGLWWEAAGLGPRLRLGALTVLLIDGQEEDRLRMAACGWGAADAAHGGPQLRCLAGAPPAAAVAAAMPSRSGGLRGDWPPVRLASMPPGGLPPWPWSGASALEECEGALRWLANREARVLVAHQAAPWSGAPATAATLLALAQLAGEGLRVCWRLPPGALLAWSGMLAEIGRRGFALKLLLAASELPALAQLGALTGWWVIAPADAREGAAALAQAVDSEDAVLIALPMPVPELPPWPPEEPYMPGSGRALAPGADLTLVCESRSAALALAARARLADLAIDAGVLHCTSLLPLPRTQLEACAARAPLVVVGGAALAGGLAMAVRCALPAAAVVGLGDEPGLPLDLARIVSAAQGALRPPPDG